MNEWLLFSLLTLGVWLIVYILKPNLRKEMFWVSLFTAPLALTEIIFVPEYWSPPSLFNLAARTGFDIESFIWVFAIGGLAAIPYEFFVRVKHKKIGKSEIKKYKFHPMGYILTGLTFLGLYFFTNLNPIYSTIIALLVGGISTIICRPDLTKNVLSGGLILCGLYFIFFLIFLLIFPDFVANIWNFKTISGVLLLGIPLEELLFAFTAGMMWSSIYEHIMWYKLVK